MQLDQIKIFFDSQEETYKQIGDEGVIMSIGDGIVKACGLRSETAGEMFNMSENKGMALNLEHDRVGLVFFGDSIESFNIKNFLIGIGYFEAIEASIALIIFIYFIVKYKDIFLLYCRYKYKHFAYIMFTINFAIPVKILLVNSYKFKWVVLVLLFIIPHFDILLIFVLQYYIVLAIQFFTFYNLYKKSNLFKSFIDALLNNSGVIPSNYFLVFFTSSSSSPNWRKIMADIVKLGAGLGSYKVIESTEHAANWYRALYVLERTRQVNPDARSVSQLETIRALGQLKQMFDETTPLLGTQHKVVNGWNWVVSRVINKPYDVPQEFNEQEIIDNMLKNLPVVKGEEAKTIAEIKSMFPNILETYQFIDIIISSL